MLLAAAFPEFVDPNPSSFNQFGQRIVPLSTGNVVITAPGDDAGGPNAGAVYLFNGTTGDLISTITGSNLNDNIGDYGVVEVGNGNFLILSLNWNNGAIADAGAITWGSGVTGVSGVVSAANSLVGSTANDRIGQFFTKLSNGNIVFGNSNWDNGAVVNAGASTFIDGSVGLTGVITSSNSLIGSRANDGIGLPVATELPSGNYVLRNPTWDNGVQTDAGAVTWGSGTTGVSGVISASNSLVGSTINDQVGAQRTLTVLSSGNYVIRTPTWNRGQLTDAGAVTWGSGTAGVRGVISASNSLIGSSAGDGVGEEITVLTNGNFVVSSSLWNNVGASDAGAATWVDGATGLTGEINSGNSLVGTTANDRVALLPITALSNGNYVVSSSNWNLQAGAVTWGNGTTGIIGAVSVANSLVGDSKGDQVGVGGLYPLPNGNYVVISYVWDNGLVQSAGAVTWGNGATGTTGVVGASNSLVGTQTNDEVGRFGVAILTNGNYVVRSNYWNNGTETYAGAVTWGSGTTGVTGAVSPENSLVGSSHRDEVGLSSIILLPNGNYVVSTPVWDSATSFDVGAVTWGSGTAGVSGTISSLNSLIGSADDDEIGGQGISVLSNGNYVVRSPFWNNFALNEAGAITWASGTSGLAGVVSSTNSLVGMLANDLLGNSAITELSDGNFVIRTPGWNNGAVVNAGAVTWVDGQAGIVGTISAANSLVGTSAQDSVGGEIVPLPGGRYVVRSNAWSGSTGAVTWSPAGGITGAISALNSLVGSSAGNAIGAGGITVLGNGNYVVSSPGWDNGGTTDVGAVTWASGTAGVSGLVSVSNSLIGSTASDRIGTHGITVVGGINYLVRSAFWDNGSAVNAGAVTWGNGVTGVAGVVSSANSLVSDLPQSDVGADGANAQGGIRILSNGNYLVVTPTWQNGVSLDYASVTWGSATAGVTGVISTANSMVGANNAVAGLANGIHLNGPGDTYVIAFPSQSQPGRVFVGSKSTGYSHALDIDPVDANSATNVIAENVSNGASVGITVFASDPPNSVAYSLTNDAGGRFAINATSGIVTVANASLLNYEVAASHAITVRAASQDGSFSDQSFSINVSDFDEFNVGEVTDSNPAVNSILEHSAVGTPVGLTAVAGDADGTNSGITYMLWDDRGGRFAINAATGVVTVANSEVLAHATGSLWSIRVIAISQDGSYSFKDFTIAITGNNPVSPVTDTNATANSVADNAANGSTVGITAFAVDADATNNTVTYSLANNAGGRFAINSTTGVVTVANAALLASANQHTITVQAASSDGSTSTQSFTIAVTSLDAFDVSEITDTNTFVNLVLEHAPVGTVVGITAFAQDLDSANNQISYMLWDTRGGRFAINATTGVVTVANSELLDRNTLAWSIRVIAISQDGSYSFKDFTISVLGNAFNVGPVTDTDAAANAVANNAANGSAVGITAFASDADSTNNTVTYSLTNNAGGRFTVHPTTGVVTVANSALLSSASQHTITVQAASSDGSTSSRSFTIAVTALDDFDVGAITDTNAAANSVPEYSPVGTPVSITAFAQDLDSSNNQITYMLWDTRGGRFAINAVTGVVTVANSELLDRNTPLWSIRVIAISQDGSYSFKDFMIAIT